MKGNIIKEIGFDEITRTYERSQAGLVQRIHRPGDRWTAYQHDGLGNVIRADYYDDTWETFGYDKIRDGITKWYVGKANNLYTRLRQHLGTGNLTSSQLKYLQVLVIPHGKEADFFKAEAGMIKAFEDAGEDLANKKS